MSEEEMAAIRAIPGLWDELVAMVRFMEAARTEPEPPISSYGEETQNWMRQQEERLR